MPRIPASILIGLLLSTLCAFAERPDGQAKLEPSRPVHAPFERGAKELQFGGGLFVSENYFDIYRPQMNDVDATLRLGWMLNSPTGPSIIRGNFELLLEVFGGGFVKGPADVIAGTTVFVRYNWVQPSPKFVPYVHVGGGAAYSDAHQNELQRELGSAVSFNLQVGFGARYLCTEKWGLFLEFDYRHLSNAALAERNVGLNSYGSWLGASYFF